MMYSFEQDGATGAGKQNPEMKRTTSILFFSFLGLLGIAFLVKGFAPFGGPEPNPQKEAVLVRAILEGLNRLHFQPREVNDDFSKDVFALYLKDLDAGKRFFNRADFELFKQHELLLDDQANAGTFEFFNLSDERYNQAIQKTQAWYQDILSRPLDFSANDILEADGDKLDWAKDDAELRLRWERWMKYEVLSRVTDEQDKQEKPEFKETKKSFEELEADARKKVLEAYDRLFKRLKKADRTKRLEAYLNALTNVFDPHTGYFSPKEKENFDINMSGKLEGIGARLQSDGEKTTATEIVPGGPAWNQGELQAKDVILKVAQGDGEFEDIMGWEIDDVVSKIRGPKGSRVRLAVQKPDGQVKEITIVRDVVIMEEGLAKSLILRLGTDNDKIGYIYLPKFYADFTPQGSTSCAADVAKEVEKLKAENVQGIILDLRNNGGGSLRDVVQMSGLFIEQGPIVQVKSRSRKPEIMEDYDARVQWGGPMVVMVNGFSASASEILAAAMQDYGRALIVGAAGTYGKGTVQRFFDLDNATAMESVKPLGEMKLTVQKFYRISGKTTQLDGVTPDIVLPDSYNLMELGERENDFPLQSNTIEPVPYNQNTYRIADMKTIKTNSAARVKSDTTFQRIADNAMRLRKQRDQTQYPLQAEKYRQWDKRQEQEAKKYDDMLKPVDGFRIENLAADLPQIQADTSRAARNDSWLKERKKDIQLFETVLIMKDMIRLDMAAVKGKQ
ncbi:MAG: carboxy terminal-processing peptidase [Saprospiraceae bacterium]